MGLGRWAVGAIDAGLDARSHVRAARDLASSVTSGAGRAAWGMRGLATEGRAGRWSGVSRVVSGGVIVGNGFFHGDDDRKAAINLLSLGFDDFEHEMQTQIVSSGDAHLMQWWTITVQPAISEFRRFAAAENASYMTRFATSWDTFEQWRDRLVRMRENARAMGIGFATPEPARLPQTFTEQGSSGTGSRLTTIWTAVKLVLYALVGFAGFLGLYQVYRDVRYGHMSLKMATVGRLTA